MNPDRVIETAQQISRVLPDRQTRVLFANEKQTRVYDLLAEGLNPVNSLDLAQAVLGDQDLTDPKTRTRALSSARRVTEQIAAVLQNTPFALRDVYLPEGQNRFSHFAIVPKDPALLGGIPKSEEEHLSMDQLRDYSLRQISEFVEKKISGIYQQTPDVTPINLYRKVSSHISGRVPDEVFKKAIAASKSSVEETAKIGKQVLLFLMMKSIFKAAEHLLIEDKDIEEAVQATIAGVMNKLEISEYENQRYGVGMIIILTIRREMARYLAAKENVPLGWIDRGLIQAVFDITGSTSLDSIGNLAQAEQIRVISAICERTGILDSNLTNYFRVRQFNLDKNKVELAAGYDLDKAAFRSEEKKLIEEALHTLTSREMFVIRRRYGFEDLALGFVEGEEFTFEQIGGMLGVTDARIGQIEAKALRKLRHPKRANLLKRWFSPPAISLIQIRQPVFMLPWKPEVAGMPEGMEQYLSFQNPSDGLKKMLEDYPLIFSLVHDIPVSEIGFDQRLEDLLSRRRFKVIRPLLILPEYILAQYGYFYRSRSYKERQEIVREIKQRILEKIVELTRD